MFKNPFSFEGRIRRREYALTFVIYIAVYVLILGLISSGNAVGSLAAIVIIIPAVWFVWAQGAKRCHDIGRSGWFQIIPFFPFVMLFSDGVAEVNEYGSNPKYPDQVSAMDSETLDGHLRINS